MTRNELYESIETSSSKEALDHLIRELDEPMILLGGWAVYLLVDNSYEKEHSSHYLGSRDVDLGFHIDKNHSPDEMKNSAFARSLKILKTLGYSESGTSRYVRIIHKTTGRILSEKDAAPIPQYDLFYMYVDPIVDVAPESLKRVFNIKPIDEPLLARALKEGRMREMIHSGRILLAPEPDMMVLMKLSSFPRRTKDDKKIKDACDIYSLIWHSGSNYKDVLDKVRKEQGLIDISKPHFTMDIVEKASYHLGIEPETYIDVVGQMWR